MNKNKVIIIGNGFDRNLGLPTSYPEFMESDYFQSLIFDGNQLATHLSQVSQLQNWVDIENELTKYSKRISSFDQVGNPRVLKQEYLALKGQLMKYLGNIDLSIFDENTHAFHFLKEETKSSGIIYNFNYTNSVKEIIRRVGKPSGVDLKHHHIHGSLLKGDIVFGVQDKAQIPDNNVFLKKSYSKSFNPQNISTRLEKALRIVIFGHSLGSTDHTYFSPLFEIMGSRSSPSQKGLHIYHFGEDSYEDIAREIDSLTLRQMSYLKQNNRVEFIDTSVPMKV